MSGKSRKRSMALRTLLLGSVAIALAAPAYAEEGTTIDDLERRIESLSHELQGMKARQGNQQEELDTQRDKIEAQEELIEEQQEQISAQRESTVAVPAQVVTGGDHPGSFKLPGSDTSIKIGGYVKADLFYDINADVGNSFNTTSIPADGSAADSREGSFRAQARQSRLNFTTWTPTPVGEVKTLIEGDFLGSTGNELFSNSTGFRLRHAYGELSTDNWTFLFGQTWTNFMPLTSYPDTVDFFGPTGIPFIRQGQARVTYKGVPNFKISVSLENSELNARDTTGARFTSESGGIQFGIDTLPDFVGAVEYNKDGYHFKVAGLGRFLETEGNTVGDDDEFAWGIFLGTSIPVPIGDDYLVANFTYGDGIGRYLINGFLQDASINAVNGDLETIEQWGVAAGYTHYWSDQWRSNLVYGHTGFEDTFAVTDFESLDTIHTNLMWTPSGAVQFGIEYIYGAAGFANSGLDNEANRVQFGAQYFF